MQAHTHTHAHAHTQGTKIIKAADVGLQAYKPGAALSTEERVGAALLGSGVAAAHKLGASVCACSLTKGTTAPAHSAHAHTSEDFPNLKALHPLIPPLTMHRRCAPSRASSTS